MSEIVVTGLRRTTTLQTTPAAITAVTGATIAKMGIQTSEGLERVAPSLIVTENPLGGARYTLRNIRAPGEATVGLYYDDVPIIGSPGVANDAGGTAPSVSLFDVDRVEVLRGPQGTLYGAGSEAGTVRFIFAKPRLSEFEGDVDLQGTDYAHGGGGGQVQAMVNAPLIDGKLAVRAAGFYADDDGYINNLYLNDKGENGLKREGGRVLLRYEPISTITLDGMIVVNDKKGAVGDWQLGQPAYDQTYKTYQPYRDDFDLYSGTLKWDLGFANLNLIGSYSSRLLEYNYDFAFFNYVAKVYPVGSAIHALAASQDPASAYAPQRTDTSTEEARLDSQPGGPLQWTLGFFHSLRNAHDISDVVGVDAAGNPIDSTLYYSRYINDSLEEFAGYGEGTYSITRKWDFTFGARYYDYSRDTGGAVTQGNVLVGAVASPYSTGSTDESGWLVKINSDYKFTRDIMGYAQASQGYRPGGVNQVVGLPASLAPYASDSLWDYEAGLKTAWLDRRLTINADIFQIDWSNIQVTGTSATQVNGATFTFISNAGDARVRGVEFDTAYEPIRKLTFQFSGSYLDSVLTTNQTSSVLAAPGKKGDDIPYAPKLTLQGGSEYDFNLPASLQGLIRADINYVSSSWNQFVHTNVFEQKLPGYTNISLRTGVSQPGAGWAAYLFVNNLLDKAGIDEKTNTVLFGSPTATRVISIAPRTVGVELTKHF